MPSSRKSRFQKYPNIGIFCPFDPVSDQKNNSNKVPRWFSVWVPKRGLYLARHLFTLYILTNKSNNALHRECGPFFFVHVVTVSRNVIIGKIKVILLITVESAYTENKPMQRCMSYLSFLRVLITY